MKNYIRLIRPKQWMKNVFVLLPLFFGGALLKAGVLWAGLITFLAYSFTASAVYCINDIVDAPADRRHPVKCNRPIASGAVSVRQAFGIMAVLLILAAVMILLLPDKRMEVAVVILFYFVLNVAYCAKLKQYAILDVCIVSFGFVLRILAGGIATGVYVSKWLVLMTFLLTLFLSFAKRRDDVLRMNNTGEPPRKNTIRYNITFINQAITITGSVMLVCYIMYTVSPEVVANFHTDYLYLTTVFVLLGLLRYIQITVVDEKSGDPTKVVLQDRFVELIIVAWVLSFLFIIYLS
ncbi:MAG: decaprenyl-phosphate phosphoribosyltransferase [Prevotella sp.]|nr:decaprenyl-phosphate phosphoribosyltransferase [Prevotella sp.]